MATPTMRAIEQHLRTRFPVGAVFDADDVIDQTAPIEVSAVLRELVDEGLLRDLDPVAGAHVPKRYMALWDGE